MTRFALRLLTLVVASLAAFAAPAATLQAIEYYDPALDHYFVTSFADEIQKLDAGVFAGWQRTGQQFTVFDPATPMPGAAPVCRFYGVPSAGLDSHFYSASPAECAAVLQRFPGVWIEETANAFGIYLPDTATGACPASTVPVYRAWNGRVDSNHRFTTDLATFQAMLAKGYVAEGYGPEPYPVAMCSPSSSRGSGPVPACVLAASTLAPYVGDGVTLTASCSNGPVSYTWTNCASTSPTCTATSAAVGAITYTVFADNAAGRSAPATVTLAWQTPPPPPKCTIARTSQTDPPTVGGFVVLQANCDVPVGSYSWSGCASTTSVCTVRETTPGVHAYTVIARNAGGSSAPTTLAVSWAASAPAAPGLCSAFPSYLASDVGSSSVRVESVLMPVPPGFAWNGAWTVRFVVPPAMPASALARLSTAEFAGPATVRQATISRTPCDFRPVDPSGASGPYSQGSGTTVTLLFTDNPGQSSYPVLAPGGTYYFNVRNFQPSSGTTTCPSSAGSCNALVEALLPG